MTTPGRDGMESVCVYSANYGRIGGALGLAFGITGIGGFALCLIGSVGGCGFYVNQLR